VPRFQPQNRPGVASPAPDAPHVLEPDLIRAARLSYYEYVAAMPAIGATDRPIGIAVNRISHRAKVVFRQKPLLLPQEYFVPAHLVDPNG